LVLVLIISGCGAKNATVQSRFATITGAVKCDGRPLVCESVVLYLENGPALNATTDIDGNYRLENVPPVSGVLIAHFLEESGFPDGRELRRPVHIAPRENRVENFEFRAGSCGIKIEPGQFAANLIMRRGNGDTEHIVLGGMNEAGWQLANQFGIAVPSEFHNLPAGHGYVGRRPARWEVILSPHETVSLGPAESREPKITGRLHYAGSTEGLLVLVFGPEIGKDEAAELARYSLDDWTVPRDVAPLIDGSFEIAHTPGPATLVVRRHVKQSLSDIVAVQCIDMPADPAVGISISIP
jgi:hypothetical protein